MIHIRYLYFLMLLLLLLILFHRGEGDIQQRALSDKFNEMANTQRFSLSSTFFSPPDAADDDGEESHEDKPSPPPALSARTWPAADVCRHNDLATSAPSAIGNWDAAAGVCGRASPPWRARRTASRIPSCERGCRPACTCLPALPPRQYVRLSTFRAVWKNRPVLPSGFPARMRCSMMNLIMPCYQHAVSRRQVAPRQHPPSTISRSSSACLHLGGRQSQG